jgi:predicted glycogen debranching enzyme
MITINRAVLQNFNDAAQYEWLETNGLGGWSGSSVIGAHTRRYHGLLTAAIVPPAERLVLLSKLDETIVHGDKREELGVNLYPGHTIHPSGHHYLHSFSKDLFPEWIYDTGEIKIRKRIAMVHGENTVVILYDVLESPFSFTLEFLPLVAARGYHSLAHEGPQLHWDADFSEGTFHNKPDGKTDLYIHIPGAAYSHQPRWFQNFQYRVEEYRGLDFSEDLLNHGTFSVELKKGSALGLIVSTDVPKDKDAFQLYRQEKQRRTALLNNQPEDEMLRQLILAADQFIVKRDDDLKTIIAGYHWFTDWGRDTMISLPGLCLSTGRYDDAKKILAAFAKSVSEGMLPNRFQDNGEAPEYNNVDGTLWYFISVYKYLNATGDKEFVLQTILPVLKDIIDWHFKGTRYHIHVTDDGLLYAGEKGQQLTWMDARIGDWVVTPRMGKPVEIQALWYNVLKIFAELLEWNGQTGDAAAVTASAEKAKQSFSEQFWNAEGNYLYDVIDENGKKDAMIRPNQLFAISLPFPLIGEKEAKAVLDLVTEKLYTPAGLRSLSPDDPHYVAVYGGDQYKRDSSYHQGTVWSWLLGPFIDAVIATDEQNGEQKAKRILDEFRYHFSEGCIGSVSEIMDAGGSHHPRGCVAQAWGVAELLRVIKEYGLYKKRRTSTKEVQANTIQ